MVSVRGPGTSINLSFVSRFGIHPQNRPLANVTFSNKQAMRSTKYLTHIYTMATYTATSGSIRAIRHHGSRPMGNPLEERSRSIATTLTQRLGDDLRNLSICSRSRVEVGDGVCEWSELGRDVGRRGRPSVFHAAVTVGFRHDWLFSGHDNGTGNGFDE